MKSINNKAQTPIGRSAVIYIRVSSAEQVEGTSLDDQETRCRRYCEEQGYEVLAIFREEGESAKSADRKKLLEAMEFCRKHKNTISAFVVWKVDRFARNTEDHFAVRKILLDYGTTLLSVTETIGNSPSEKLLETILAATSEFDNSIRKQRCTNGMIARIQQGIWPWKPPVGYACANHKKHGEKKTEPDKPNQEVFPLIQKVLKGFARQIYTQSDMARALAKTDFERLTGTRPTPQLAERLLNNHLAFYAGWLPNPWPDEGGSLIRGKHQPMITDEEMETIRLIRSGRTINVVRNRNNPQFPLRRLLKCPSCGRCLTGSSPKGRKAYHAYYHCFNKECTLKNKMVRKEDVEKAFLVLLRHVTPTERFLKYFNHVVLTRWNSKIDELRADAKKHEDAIQEFAIRRKNVFEMREIGIYTQEQFTERLAEVENHIAVEKVMLSETRIDQYDIEAGAEYCKQAIRDVVRQWLDLTPTLRTRFQKVVFPEGIAYDRKDGFGTVKLGRIYELYRQHPTPNSSLVDTSYKILNRMKSYLAEFWGYYRSNPTLQQALTSLEEEPRPEHS
jgi:DNA invertase Pin-like site-specific DNA recombinase